MKKEIWMLIPGFPDYKIDSSGDIISTKHVGNPIKIKPIILRDITYYNLNRDGVQYRYPMLKILYAAANKISIDNLDDYIFCGSSDKITVTTRSEISVRINEDRRRNKAVMSKDDNILLCNKLMLNLSDIMEYYKTGDTSILFDIIGEYHKGIVKRLMYQYRLCEDTAEEYYSRTVHVFIEKVNNGHLFAGITSFSYLSRMASSLYLQHVKERQREKLYHYNSTPI